MSNSTIAKNLFFENTDLTQDHVEKIVSETLQNADDGELFLEFRQSESIVFDDGKVKSAAFDTSQGFGLRAIAGESSGYSHTSELSNKAVSRASNTVKAVANGHSGELSEDPRNTNQSLYSAENPLTNFSFEDKINLLTEVDKYARSKDERVRQASASISGEWQVVQVFRSGGQSLCDIRPLVRINISVMVEQNGRMETGSYGIGGRTDYSPHIKPAVWKQAVDHALDQARVNLDSVPAPAGEIPVVLGPGWPGILLHEAIGHGLEGDFNRKGTSAFSGLMGERVASPGVTVIDDGTINERRGSLSIDDEGTPTDKTVLIENGILKGYLQDRMNGRLMKTKSTGNGRRQSYSHAPIPRMTNTFMLNGSDEPKEIIESVKNGIYAVSFGGGQVDITSGKFVFSCTEAYKIENGKLGAPLRGATLIGSGPEILTKVSKIGNDLKLDPGIGTCGKDGQGVPVGVGQPTLLIDNITVGGTAV